MLATSFSITDVFPKQNRQVQQAEAQALPLVIRDRFTEIQLAGDAAAGSRFLIVDEDFVDPENHCEFCTRVEYIPGPRGVAGFAYEDLTGLDLSNARKAQFWAMGEEGDERIKFKLAGKSLDRIQDRIQDRLGQRSDRLASEGIFTTERFALTTQEVTLDDTWQKYEVDLTGADLRDITHPFAFELSEDDDRQVIYIKGVVYDDEPAEDPLVTISSSGIDPLAAEIVSNGTEGVAPTTFAFEANITGGTEPYSINWDFDDNNNEGGQNVVHTFEEVGEYNVTLAVTDSGGQNASSSITIQVAESEIMEEEIVEDTANDILTDTNTTDAVGEVDSINNTDDVTNEQNSTDDQTAEPIEMQVDAGMDIIAQSGDTVILEGEITGIDAEAEDLTIEWTQTSGPSVEIDGDDSLNPIIAIPELDDDAELELEFSVSFDSMEESDSVIAFVQHIEEMEDALEESLTPTESAITEWASECGDQADCMGDDSASTFATSHDVGSVNLFRFEEFGIENAEIVRVTAVVTARADETGYLVFIGADIDDPEDQSDSEGAVPIASNSYEEYEFVWEENPVTGSPWTVESLNSLLAGYRYGGGQSDIEVNEFELIVVYTVEESPSEPELEPEESEPEQNSEVPVDSRETEDLVLEENSEQVPEQTEESPLNETRE